jgi:hypothetical protein
MDETNSWDVAKLAKKFTAFTRSMDSFISHRANYFCDVKYQTLFAIQQRKLRNKYNKGNQALSLFIGARNNETPFNMIL